MESCRIRCSQKNTAVQLRLEKNFAKLLQVWVFFVWRLFMLLSSMKPIDKATKLIETKRMEMRSIYIDQFVIKFQARASCCVAFVVKPMQHVCSCAQLVRPICWLRRRSSRSAQSSTSSSAKSNIRWPTSQVCNSCLLLLLLLIANRRDEICRSRNRGNREGATGAREGEEKELADATDESAGENEYEYDE